MSTHIKTMMKSATIAERAKMYGIDGLHINGMDVIEVYKISKEIIERVRAGSGLVLLECETYRFKGHSKSDHRKYRSREEEGQWERRCPIRNLRKEIISAGLLNEQDLVKIEDRIRVEIEDAYRYAMNADVLPEKDILKDVFYE
jgi:pyruvate dehydrogenase E1 component alpha subunit